MNWIMAILLCTDKAGAALIYINPKRIVYVTLRKLFIAIVVFMETFFSFHGAIDKYGAI